MGASTLKTKKNATLIIPAALLAGIILFHAVGVESHWLWIASFVLIGMPHGAYDVWRLQDQSRNPLTTGLKIALYLLIVVAYLCLWQRLPVFSLFLFLSLTAWHWGIADSYWIEPKMNSRRVSLGLFRGIWIVSLPIAADFQGAGQIMELMVSQSSHKPFLFEQQWQALFLVVGIIALSLETFLHLRKRRLISLGETVLLALLAVILPASLFLVSYFIAVHSWRYLYERFCVEGDLFLKPARWAIVAGISLLIIPIWYQLYLASATEATGPSLTASYLLMVSAFTLPHAILLQIQDSFSKPPFPLPEAVC
ncbi:MAG: Brp/Blh family beta-carotene 15,15'-dioxygenase [Luteolibacter sp.]